MQQQRGAQWHQPLAAHRRRAAPEQHLDLGIVALGRGLAEIAIGLEMEFATVIGRVSFRRRFRHQTLTKVAMAARLDRAEIGKEIGGAAQPIERVAAPVIRRGVDALGDVLPITLDQLPQIPDQPLPVGRLAAAQFVRDGHRFR